MEHKTYSKEAYDKESQKIVTNSEVTHEDYAIFFTSITILMETFLRSRNVNSTDLTEALRELKFADECVEDITKVLISNQPTLSAQLQEMIMLKPVDDLQTRINISLVESGQNPTIILFMRHNGKTQIVNLSLKHFHRFRLAVASILADVHAR